MRNRVWLFVGVAAGFCLGAASPSLAWWGDGHALLARASVQALPEGMPAFFRAGGETVAHSSYDPDLFKNRATPQGSHGEHAEHFFDLELLQGKDVPQLRYDFVALCAELGVAPDKVGFAPYAVAEWTQHLMVAFAEHRKWPQNQTVQQKCLLFAGLLAHYAQDMCQPLHMTIHFDGRVPAVEGAEPTRVHEKVDSLVERLEVGAEALAQQVEVVAFDSLMGAIDEQIMESNGRVDRVYELEAKIDQASDPAVRAFGLERAHRATAFTASLFFTAWEQSASLRLPGWLDRD
ncbi:MAG: hypothetical protein GKR89_27195 [Candidatus Latescibacteria bacterium]|nr:hypothetical protein [Candidatus Latescibacterota bacterium]